MLFFKVEYLQFTCACMIKFIQMQIAEKQKAFIQAFCSCNFICAFVLFTFLSHFCRLQNSSWNSTKTTRVTLVSCPLDCTMKDCCTDIDSLKS